MLEPAHILLAGLVRRTWLVVLATVIACATFAAHAVAALVEASYLGPSAHGTPPPARVATRPARVPPPDGAELVARNMFCSTCAPGGEPGSSDRFEPGAVLIATSVGGEPRATLRVLATGVQGSFGAGDELPGVGRIAAIAARSVELIDARGRHARLALLDPGAATPEVGPAGPAAPAGPDAAWADRIRRASDGTLEVDRSLVRELVAGTARPGAVRVSPVLDDGGRMAGVRLTGIGRGSLPAALGLRSGDTLSEINGVRVDSANAMLGIYEQLDRVSNVELDGTRAGKPLAITLRLR